MKQYVCSICSYTYDESKGIPEAGIPPGTRWEDLPDDWTCPLCGAVKDMFVEKDSEPQPAPPAPAAASPRPHQEPEKSPLEMGILGSNRARGGGKDAKPWGAGAAENVKYWVATRWLPGAGPGGVSPGQRRPCRRRRPRRAALPGLEREGHPHPEIPFGPLPEGGRKDAGKHRRLCLHHLRVCLCGG